MKKILAAITIATSVLAGSMLSTLPASAATDSTITPKIWSFYDDFTSLANCISKGEQHRGFLWRAYNCEFSNDGTEYQWDLYVDWL